MTEKTQSTHAVFLQVEIRGIPATPNISGLNFYGDAAYSSEKKPPKVWEIGIGVLVTMTLVACPSIVDT